MSTAILILAPTLLDLQHLGAWVSTVGVTALALCVAVAFLERLVLDPWLERRQIQREQQFKQRLERRSARVLHMADRAVR